jgi:tagatose 6-phosphate kinase
MIIAAGLSPAWQSVMRFSSLTPGEVNRATATWSCASGKVLNVAVALRHLGADCRAVTVLGGPPAVSTEGEFAALGIDLVVVPTHATTRTCTTLLDDATGRTTELVENAAAITDAEQRAFVTAYADAVASAKVAVLSGSLPAGTPHTLYRELMAVTPCPVVLDARGPELLAALGEKPLLVKPNREELARTVGATITCDEELFAAMEQLRSLGALWVVVTDGPRPISVVGPEGRCRLFPPPLDSVENPIGSGDCLAAGFAVAIGNGQAPVDALRYGIACATENCRSLFAGRLDRERVSAWASQIVIEPR